MMKSDLIVQLIIGFLALYCIYGLPTPKNTINKQKNPMENLNLFEGDMLLSPRARGVLARGSSIAWPNGIVPYEFSSEHSSSDQQIIASAMRKMESVLAVNNVKCIQFRPRTSSDSVFIVFRNRGGCFSAVGRGSGNGDRTVSLGSGCVHEGIIMHELLHALGFFHEQSRPDRDSYVRINWGNIIADQEHNFQKYDNTAVDTQNFPYDYSSIMHYDRTAFSKNNQPTIEPLQSGVTIGQINSMSAIDIAEVRKFYKCSAPSGNIQWNGNWAHACDFRGNDLSSAQIRGEDCSGRCAATSGCTHFTWTTYNGGTCWMKRGTVSKSNAVYTGDQSMVCGLLATSPPGTIQWNGNWAHACDFRGNDLSSAQIRGEDCSGRCAATSGCTHFTWTTYNGGTCWMKRGTVSKSNAFYTGDQSMVCGVQ